jgi:hypothetical protein
MSNPIPHELVACPIEEMVQKYPARISSWGGNRSTDPEWMTDGTILLSSHAIPDERKRFKYQNLPPKEHQRDVSSERLHEVIDQYPVSEYVQGHFVGYRSLERGIATAFYAFTPYEYDSGIFDVRTNEIDYRKVEWATLSPRLVSLVQSLFECSLERIYIHRTTQWESYGQPPALVYKVASLFDLGMTPDALIMPKRVSPTEMTKGRSNRFSTNSYTPEEESL